MNAKKYILLVFSLFLIYSTCFADTSGDHTPEPYKKDEFPATLKALRRAEIITLGSLPFVTMSYGFLNSVYGCATHNFDTSYMSSPLVRTTDPDIIKTACFISIGIGVVDFVFYLIKDANRQKKLKAQRSPIYITQDLPATKLNANATIQPPILDAPLDTDLLQEAAQDKKDQDLQKE